MPWRVGYLLLFWMLSCIAYSQVPLSTALSLAPPASDGSMIYLASIFGTVEGVLSSSGSQIFGHLMGIFNLTVLALGSIVIMYTLIVGTLNTAHEGEFLGKHWSSIWLPVRATIGMTLLVPKTSGFCLMQIIVMWVVVQGIGAADKVWSEALDYLNMGGKLVMVQQSSESSEGYIAVSYNRTQAQKDLGINKGKKRTTFIPNPAYNGAVAILTGQVCAYMMQRQLEKLRDDYLAQANPNDGTDPSGPCAPSAVKSAELKSFCDNPVPDFLNGLNTLSIMKLPNNVPLCENDSPSIPDSWEMSIPNFDSNMPVFYANLKNKCGSIKWKSMSPCSAKQNLNLTSNQANSIAQSRGIATQQMIDFLQPVARAMVDNDPQINKNLISGASDVAFSQYGVALNNSGKSCSQKGGCYSWGASTDGDSYKSSILFAGNEFYNAVNAYDGVMQPMLALEKNSKMVNAKRFIGDAKKNGWIYAGGYFFQMARLSGDSTTSAEQDEKSGLDDSTMPQLSACPESSDSDQLCQALGTQTTNSILDKINNLISGTIVSNSNATSVCQPAGLSYNFKASSAQTYGFVTKQSGDQNIHLFQDLKCSSTTLGFIGNSYFLSVPGQPDITIPQLQFPTFNPITFKMPKFHGPHKHCHGIFCISMGINIIISAIGIVISAFQQLIYLVVMSVFSVLITGMFNLVFDAFIEVLNQLRDMSLSPIVNIANLGATMIQAGGELSVQFFLTGMELALIPEVGMYLVLLFILTAPFITVWIVYFFSTGFLTAYYVPLYPYMLFLFGVIAWLIAVIEAMVAAPIVALGIMSPEGEGILGKSETGMMILVNVFLRPSMMIIGFITGTILTYVSVWILNYHFDVVAKYLIDYDPKNSVAGLAGVNFSTSFFAQIFGVGSYIAVYVGIYITLVQKSFGLIFQLPDKVLRWIGAQQESFGQEVQHWGDETKQKIEQSGGQAQKGIQSSVETVSKELSGDTDGQEGKGSVKPRG